MRHSSSSLLLLGALLAGGCGVLALSAEDKKALANHQANAQLYYDGQKYDQAEDQVSKGLALDPKDYKLNLVLAMILLQRGKNDPKWLPEAKDQFDKTLGLRASGKLDSRTHMGVGLCSQRMAQVLKSKAVVSRKEADSGALSPSEKQARLARAEQFDKDAAGYLVEARESFQLLLESGELTALAHYHLFQVATLEKRLADAQKHGNDFRTEARQRQAFLTKQLETSFDANREDTLRGQQRELRAQELEVLGLLANIAFEQNDARTALTHLDELLKLDTTRTPDYLNRARCLVALKNYTRAKEDVEVFLQKTQLPFESSQVKEALELRRQLEQLVLTEKGETGGKRPLGDQDPRHGRG
jgi:predicted Zn-dependent protease